jgi:hypothetical protein
LASEAFLLEYWRDSMEMETEENDSPISTLLGDAPGSVLERVCSLQPISEEIGGNEFDQSASSIHF